VGSPKDASCTPFFERLIAEVGDVEADRLMKCATHDCSKVGKNILRVDAQIASVLSEEDLL
jgi:hypothetical protein